MPFQIIKDGDTVHLWDDKNNYVGTQTIESLGLPKGQKNYTDQEIQKALLNTFTGTLDVLGVPKEVTETVRTGRNLDTKQLMKDIIPDLATAAITAGMPGGSFLKNLGRAGVGAGTNAILDQFLNPDKLVGNSILDAAGSTALSMAIPGIHANKFSKTPDISVGGNPLYRLFATINPMAWSMEPRTVTRMVQDRGKGGKWLKAVPKEFPIKLSGFKKFLEGFSGNIAYDTWDNYKEQ